jgi:hypothetical protein
MQKHELEIAVRLTALEFVVSEIGCAIYAALGTDMDRLRAATKAKFQSWTIPGLADGYSDHIVAGTQEAWHCERRG